MSRNNPPAWASEEYRRMFDEVVSEICHETGEEPYSLLAEIAFEMQESPEAIEAALQARDLMISEGVW